MRRRETRGSAIATAIALVVAAGFATSAIAQSRTPSGNAATQPAAVQVQPPEVVYNDAEERLRQLRIISSANDSLSSEELARRVARIYRFQSELLDAEASGDLAVTEDILTRAMNELRALGQRPGIMEQQRFRELYRTVVSEYESYYGNVDGLTIEQGDIFEVRAEMFAALDRVNNPLLEDVMMGHLGPMQTVFPMDMNRLVENSIAFLTRNPERHLFNWLARADTYFPMIEQILREEGVPDELKYLAMIESGLNPQARSWAGAGGMWQFMPATGRVYGLNITNWMDERNDPEKATRAAARHLRDLYEMFGDWQLALAGYNWGSGGVSRAIRRIEPQLGRKPNYWEIWHVIPNETRNYVPMFIATAIVASNPEAFNLRPTRTGPRYEYDHVPVPGMVSLNTIASMAGTDASTIRALNPELRRNSTPPTSGHYMIRLPLGSHGQFAAALKNAPKEKRQGATHYTVRRGDTLNRIASQFGTTVAALQEANNLRGTTIGVGQSLVVPVPLNEVAFSGNPASVRATQVQYGTHVRRPIDVALAQHTSGPSASAAPAGRTASTPVRNVSTAPATAPTAPARTIYRVRRGDTLGDIARRHGVTVANLRSWNNLRGDRINIGQRLTIHGAAASATASSNTTTTARATTHTVRRGETLSTIARRYGVSISQLRSWNGIRGDRIVAGQRLRVSN